MSLLVSNKKLLILLNPRCASRTLLKAFIPLCSQSDLEHYNLLKANFKRLDHLTLKEAESEYSRVADLSEYTALIAIRNPFERIISFYWFLKTLDHTHYRLFVSSLKKYDTEFYKNLDLIKDLDFNSFVSLPYFNNTENLYSFYTFCLKNFKDSNIIKKIKIIKIENLSLELEKIGIKTNNIHEHRLSIPGKIDISAKSRNIIASTFVSDIFEGNYI